MNRSFQYREVRAVARGPRAMKVESRGAQCFRKASQRWCHEAEI